MTISKVSPADLRLRVDPVALGFSDTSGLLQQPLPWIGQERAEQAARFGLQMAQPGYNLFVVGDAGSGRSSLMNQMVSLEAARRPVPPDLCYLHNFETPEQPCALRLPAGKGRVLRQLMANLAKTLQTQALKRLPAQDAKAECERIKPLLDRELQEIRSKLREQIEGSVKLRQYLDRVQREVLENLAVFLPGAEREELRTPAALPAVLAYLHVNVVVDNHAREGAPVIVEDNPLLRSLFGSVDYGSESDMRLTDFSRIRAGNLLKAHGGFLMLHLRDLLADQPLWEKFHRFLRSGRVQIEEPGVVHAPFGAVSLQPEPVDVDVKIILIASVDEYGVVQENDPEFARRFRCKVDFVETFTATAGTRRATAIFVAHLCRKMDLLHFSAAAVASLIEETHREAEDQLRQSAVFARLEALVIESAGFARTRGAVLVDTFDVRCAIEARVHRHDYPEQRLQESIIDGERLLEVSGERAGQVNGLAIIDAGDYEFGFPVRVTASTHAGEEGLLNIEREVELSGPIHDKGVLILQSYLSALFAHIAPLALNAAVVFEQEYSGVEGDSASCAVFYALLSALSGLPLQQGIAVTGALNQHGEMLPVGGINEKIEGHFRSCELLGLDGLQGVLIPQRNRRNLMLAPRLVEAVSAGRFHIYTAEHASEGMELLTQRSFGVLGPGGYPAETVLGQAQKTLQDYRRACENLDTRKPIHKMRPFSLPHGEPRRR
jgi:predicted ATP-dependent protease